MDETKRIKELEDENYQLKIEIERLNLELQLTKDYEWAHPKSCVHNEDPWEKWKT